MWPQAREASHGHFLCAPERVPAQPVALEGIAGSQAPLYTTMEAAVRALSAMRSTAAASDSIPLTGTAWAVPDDATSAVCRATGRG